MSAAVKVYNSSLQISDIVHRNCMIVKLNNDFVSNGFVKISNDDLNVFLFNVCGKI